MKKHTLVKAREFIGIRETKFELIAILNHSGTYNQGHYTSIMNHNGVWYRHDDYTPPTVVPPTELYTKENYLYVYKRVVIPIIKTKVPIFIPTYDWQVIPDNCPIPGGLHIDIDLTTGVKKARLQKPRNTDTYFKSNSCSKPNHENDHLNTTNKQKSILEESMEVPCEDIIDDIVSHEDGLHDDQNPENLDNDNKMTTSVIICKVCNRECKNLLMHLKRGKTDCKNHYDIDKLVSDQKKDQIKNKATKNIIYNKKQREKRNECDAKLYKEKAAEEERVRRKRKIEENADETRRKVAENVRKNRERKIEENADETRRKEAENERKKRERQIEENADEARIKLAEKERKNRKRKIGDNADKARRKFAENERKKRMKFDKNQMKIRAKSQNMYAKKKKQLEEREHIRRFKFLDAVRDGPIYTCVCCHKIHYKKSVHIYDTTMKSFIIEKSPNKNILHEAIGAVDLETRVRDINGKYYVYICSDCKGKVTAGRVPPMSHKNKLQLLSLKGQDCLNLTELENALVARNILFQMFLQLPKSRWTGIKKQIVSIPIYEQDIQNTLESLPRTPDQASICKVQLKRKKSMKNTHMQQYISVNKMISAIKLFQELGNDHYTKITIPESYENVVREQDPDGYELLFPEQIDSITEEDNDEINADDENDKNDDIQQDKFLNEDSIQKWKFNYDEKTIYVDDYPEINTTESNVNPTESSDVPVSVAPGEGKRPENILKSKGWDTGGFPCLHPDGKNGLHETRIYKLTDIQYFQQRILNFDRRFANTTEYVFGAYAYLELRRLESNINISFMRGKTNVRGQYSLEDAYTVLDNTPGTPKYWQKKRYELIGRLENIGPFPLFFTLSCAEKRWNENFTTFLQDHDVVYYLTSTKEYCLIDGITLEEFFQKEENISKHEYIRKNILTTTLNFNHRVKEFIKNIIMNKNSPIAVEYYNYRVEFQLRGIHTLDKTD